MSILIRTGLVAFLFILSACVATPELHMKSGDMTMQLVQTAPKVTSVAISDDGRYVLSNSYDNSFRLWDIGTGKELRQFSGQASGYMGDGIVSAFSPDGKHAVSGGRGLKIWDLTTGQVLRTFGDVRVNAVAYSSDGKYILSGGWPATIKRIQPHLILWDAFSYEIRQTFDANQYISSVALSPDGRYAASGGWRNGELKLWDVSSGKLLRAEKGGVASWLSSGVGAVAFSPDGKLLVSGEADGRIKLYSVPGFSLVKTLSGHSATDSFGDLSGVDSLSFSPDGRLIVSGGFDQFIKIWDMITGSEVRSFKAHTASAGINHVSAKFLAGGNRIVSGGDASVRIWDVATGEEIATMIGFEDGEWIITTPNGYYNSSPKGDQYLKVAVGGKDYTIEQLRESFYRPDLVKTALAGGSLRDYRRLADVKQPPTVEIVNTPSSVSRDEVSVMLRIVDTGGGIGDVRLYNNGSAVMLDSARGVQIKPSGAENAVTKSYIVKLANGSNALRAIAFNGDNTMQSADAVFQITASLAAPARPSLNALVIGINEYRNPKLQLNYAVADAKLFAETLKRVGAGMFERVNIKVLSAKEETTNEIIIKELKAMRGLRPDDLFVFYVASHGTVDEGEYFLITSNVGSTRTERLRTDALPQSSLKEAFANIPSTKKLIIIDTCNAGALGEAIQTAMLTRGMSEDTAMKILSRAVGSTILSASTNLQEALEGYNGHGLFTYVLAEGLGGKADKGKTGYVKTTELADYVDNEVPALAEKIFKRAQYPTISISGQAFPVGRVR